MNLPLNHMAFVLGLVPGLVPTMGHGMAQEMVPSSRPQSSPHSFPLNSHQVKTISVSSEGLTRISVDGETITDMFASPGDLSASLTLHESGHLFVAPSGLIEPIYVTVMTAGGHTQDLKLSFVTKKPAPILLVPQKDIVASSSQITKWLTVALLQEVPRGFHRDNLTGERDRRGTKDTVATACDRYSNGVYTITVYAVAPRQRMPLPLRSSSVSHSRRDDKTAFHRIRLSTDMYVSDDEAGLLSSTTLDCEQSIAFLAVIHKIINHS